MTISVNTMIDSITINLTHDRAGETDFLKSVPRFLSNFSDTIKSGELTYQGNLENMEIEVSLQRVKVEGSLSKFFFGDNFHTLTRSDAQRALEKLSDALHLPIGEAQVWRLDVAHHFIMESSPSSYYPFLGESTYYSKRKDRGSLYYQNGSKVKVFYDKTAEGRAKGVQIPEVYQGKNLLRYEFRFMNRLARQVKMKEVRAKDIIEEPLYLKLVKKWGEEYERIDKINLARLNPSAIRKPKDIDSYFASCYLKERGQASGLEVIDYLKAMKHWHQREYYSRAKSRIRGLCKSGMLSEGESMIEELNKKVRNVQQYCR